MKRSAVQVLEQRGLFPLLLGSPQNNQTAVTPVTPCMGEEGQRNAAGLG